MNDETGEMPNPLNPNNNPLDANPAESQPLEQIVQEVQTTSVTPAENPTPVDPMARPMEAAPVVVEPVQPKKKNTGLIIGGVIALVVAIGCGIAAAIILMGSGGDPVVKAIEKIASGNMPTYAAVNGGITIEPRETNSEVSSVEIALDTKTATNSMLNSTSASITANFKSGDKVNVDVDEIYASNGDLFLRVSNIANALTDLARISQNSTSAGGSDANCVTDENGNTICDDNSVETVDCETAEDCEMLETTETSELGSSDLLTTLGEFGGVLQAVDGQWLRISVDEMKALSENANVSMDNEMTCLTGVIANAKNYNNSIAKAYKQNSFISSTTEGVTLSSKSGAPVRKLVIDSKKFDGFKDEMKDSALVKDLRACSNASSNSSDDSSVFEEMPTLYVEVDNDSNFARVAFDTVAKDADNKEEVADVKVDFSFTYPNTIDVAEPTDYKDLSSLLQEIFMTMYTQTTPADEAVVVENS